MHIQLILEFEGGRKAYQSPLHRTANTGSKIEGFR